MESIPRELLPMICMTPACAASMRLVCVYWSALPRPRRLFEFSYNYTGPISLRSPYYEILIGNTATITHLRSKTSQSATVNDRDPWGPSRMIYDCVVSDRTFPVHHTIDIEFTSARKRVYRFHIMNTGHMYVIDLPLCECETDNYVLLVGVGKMKRLSYTIAMQTIENHADAAIYIQIDDTITCGSCPIHNELIADIRYKFARVISFLRGT